MAQEGGQVLGGTHEVLQLQLGLVATWSDGCMPMFCELARGGEGESREDCEQSLQQGIWDASLSLLLLFYALSHPLGEKKICC